MIPFIVKLYHLKIILYIYSKQVKNTFLKTSFILIAFKLSILGITPHL